MTQRHWQAGFAGLISELDRSKKNSFWSVTRSPPMKILGIDIGSTSIKGAVLDLQSGCGGHVAKYPFPEPVSGLPTGWFEIDPREVAHTVRRIVVKLLQQAPKAERLFCSGQMGGVLLVDSHCQPLTHYLSWRDQRTLAVHSNAGYL